MSPFAASAAPAQRCCEFRQNIRGQFAINGREVRHELSPGQFLDGDWREDGGVERVVPKNRSFEEVLFGPKDGEVVSVGRYGHRKDKDYDPSMDRYVSRTPPYDLDRVNGCSFVMNDMPVFPGRMGDRIKMKADFEQRIVDVCNGDAVMASETMSFDQDWTANEADIAAQEDLIKIWGRYT